MNLKQLASDVAAIYRQNHKVEGVVLGGSVARRWDDSYSDIELFVLWKNEPSDRDRKAPINKVNGSIIDYYPYEEKEWSETYLASNVKFEISNFLTDTIVNVIENVIIKADISYDKQCLVATIHDGIDLSRSKVVEGFKKMVQPYPEALREVMVNENIDLGNRWNNREALLQREDWLMLYEVMVELQTKIMGILFGLNHMYVHHPAFRWQKRSLELMEIIPENLVERLEKVFLNHPIDGIKELEVIMTEVLFLVKNENLNVDLSKAIDRSQFLRPKHNN